MPSTDDIVQAFECPHCGSLYKKKESYDKCVKACEAGNKAEEKRKKDIASLKSVLDYPRLNAKSISELETLIAQASESVSDVLGVKIKNVRFNVTYSSSVRTSHCQPIGYHEQQIRDKKMEFDGFSGTIDYEVEIIDGAEAKKRFFSDYPGSEVFDDTWGRNNITGINTGTGGGRGHTNGVGSYHYGVNLFLKDFPLMKEEFMKYKKAKEERDAILSAFSDDMFEVVEHDIVKQEMLADLRIVEDKIHALQKEADIKRSAITHYINKRYSEAADAYAESVHDYVRNTFPDLYKIVK